MQKHVNLVDLVKSFPTNILLQNLASIQKRTSPVKFAHLAEKSGKGSISNLSTKVFTPDPQDYASDNDFQSSGGRFVDVLMASVNNSNSSQDICEMNMYVGASANTTYSDVWFRTSASQPPLTVQPHADMCDHIANRYGPLGCVIPYDDPSNNAHTYTYTFSPSSR